ncbi:hypothetical protein [Xenorhabdus innexi]|uniref:Integrase n=1 Tax=Xenorhabdus innexi TaxID=290109 RepID=A0A1N6N128_9GAMM|nr:hypothetical protein [Xenorhabdus innexi]PHM31150.1 integrase [Xenorhabdus innexi]SIP74796.1 hypothetical protein XIS1_850002 [Xenorhabdus innexi]
MNNNMIKFEREINKLQFKAANELSNSWMIYKQSLTISIIRHFLEKGDNKAALSWTDGILDCLEEDFSSEIEKHPRADDILRYICAIGIKSDSKYIYKKIIQSENNPMSEHRMRYRLLQQPE